MIKTPLANLFEILAMSFLSAHIYCPMAKGNNTANKAAHDGICEVSAFSVQPRLSRENNEVSW